MAPIRRTSRAQPNNVNASLELTSIHNALQLTLLTISKIRANSKLTFSAADLHTLSSIRNNVFTIQQNVTQFSRSVGKHNANQPQSTDSNSNNTSHERIITPRRTLINTIYNRPAAKPPKKKSCWYHTRHGDNTDPRNCDGSCGFVSTLSTKQPSLSQNKENIVPAAAVTKSITVSTPTITQAVSPSTNTVVQSIPNPAATQPIHSNIPASQSTVPSTSAQTSPMKWSTMCEAEENRLLADNPDPVNDTLSQAMLMAELRVELESVSD